MIERNEVTHQPGPTVSDRICSITGPPWIASGSWQMILANTSPLFTSVGTNCVACVVWPLPAPPEYQNATPAMRSPSACSTTRVRTSFSCSGLNAS